MKLSLFAQQELTLCWPPNDDSRKTSEYRLSEEKYDRRQITSKHKMDNVRLQKSDFSPACLLVSLPKTCDLQKSLVLREIQFEGFLGMQLL